MIMKLFSYYVKAPFSSGAFTKYKTYEKRKLRFHFMGFLAGVRDSIFLEGSLARWVTGLRASMP